VLFSLVLGPSDERAFRSEGVRGTQAATSPGAVSATSVRDGLGWAPGPTRGGTSAELFRSEVP